MLPLTDSAPVPYSLLPLHCSHYSLCCSPTLSVSSHIRSASRSISVSLSLSLSLPLTHTHMHTLLQTFCLSKNQFQVCNVFSLFLSLSLASSLLLGRSPFGAFYLDFGHTVTYKLNLPELPQAVSVSWLCQKSLRNRFPTWLRIYSCCCFKLYKKTEMCLN